MARSVSARRRRHGVGSWRGRRASDNGYMIMPGTGAAPRPVADERARRYFAANRAALAASQPALAELLAPEAPALSYTLARDGYLTWQTSDGRWQIDCSLPLRAAQAMLATAALSGTTACLLAPSHAAQIRAALDRLGACQALIVIMPERAELASALACDDFSAELAARRLFFATGPQWTAELSKLLGDYEGLPTPTQFLRTVLLADEQANPLITAAQRLISDENTRRAQRLAEMARCAPRQADAGRVCVVAGSQFRLWNDAGWVLSHALLNAAPSGAVGPRQISIYDPDDPSSASTLAWIRAAERCSCVIAANIVRGDVHAVLPDSCPWIAWLTTHRAPRWMPQSPNDLLLVTDAATRQACLDCGWPADRVRIAVWPRVMLNDVPETDRHGLGLIADTQALQPPPEIRDMSSHRLLWEYITEELAGDPYRVGTDAQAYLIGRARRFDIAAESLDCACFINRLITPAIEQAVARLLIQAHLPLHLFGTGWDELDDFRAHWSGPVTTRSALHAAAGSCQALVHTWPLRRAHPIGAMDRPIVMPGTSAQSLLSSAHAMLSDRTVAGEVGRGHALDASMIWSWIDGRRIAA